MTGFKVDRSFGEETAAGCNGSRHDGRFSRFAAEKRSLKLCFQEAAVRDRAQSTLKSHPLS